MKLVHTIATFLFLGSLLIGTPALAQYPGNVNTDRNRQEEPQQQPPAADRSNDRYDRNGRDARPQTSSSRVQTSRDRTSSQSQSTPTCPPSGSSDRNRTQQSGRGYPTTYPQGRYPDWGRNDRYPDQARNDRNRRQEGQGQCGNDRRDDRRDDRYGDRRGGDRRDDRYDDRSYGSNKSRCGVPGCQHPGNHYGLHKNQGKGKGKGC